MDCSIAAAQFFGDVIDNRLCLLGQHGWGKNSIPSASFPQAETLSSGDFLAKIRSGGTKLLQRLLGCCVGIQKEAARPSDTSQTLSRTPRLCGMLLHETSCMGWELLIGNLLSRCTEKGQSGAA